MENTLTNKKNTNKNTEEEIIMKNAEVDSRSKSVYSLYCLILNSYEQGEVWLSTKVVDNKNIPTVSDNDYEAIMEILNKLPEKQKTVLTMRCGLGHEAPMDCGTVAKQLNTNIEYIRNLERKGLRTIVRDHLCELPALFGFIPPADPESNIEGVDAETDILYLGFGDMTYSILKGNRINTVGDILNYPKEDWPRAKALNHHRAMVIQDKMHKAGYPDFTIEGFVPPVKPLSNEEASADPANAINLGFDPKACSCMRVYAVNTIEDILKCPEITWVKIGLDLGCKGMDGIQARMRELGYSDFTISA